MYKTCLIIVSFCFILIGCNHNADAEDENPAKVHAVEEGEIKVEKEPATEKAEQKLQLTVQGNSYPFQFNDFPILSQYVQNFDRPEETLQNLPFVQIKEDQFFVEFACHEERCSHLLLDFGEKNSFLLSDLSAWRTTKISPDNQYAAFLFERATAEGAKHQLTVVDLSTLEPVELEAADNQLLLKPNHYQYTIHDVTFMDEEQLKIISTPMDAGEDPAYVTSMWNYQ
ncbi:hypothetical protein [Halobacillus litoralis]|uniref:hypothetical protein n=1 Tax=Halobacillus litoralis TaxID=45668 RepID=UPI002491B89B|nr:hypothetical protein [Halobacillus litoralis]